MQRDAIDILLVEDNPADVCLIREGLKLGSIPKRLKVVEDGEAALKYLADALRQSASAYEHHAHCYLTKPVGVFHYLDLIREIEDYWITTVYLPA